MSMKRNWSLTLPWCPQIWKKLSDGGDRSCQVAKYVSASKYDPFGRYWVKTKLGPPVRLCSLSNNYKHEFQMCELLVYKTNINLSYYLGSIWPCRLCVLMSRKSLQSFKQSISLVGLSNCLSASRWSVHAAWIFRLCFLQFRPCLDCLPDSDHSLSGYLCS